MRARLTALALAALVGGCATGPSQEQIAAAQSAGRQPGQIAVGDAPDYVRLQWGKPYRIHRSTYEDLRSVWWDYCTFWNYGCAEIESVHFIDGKVYAIHQ